MRKKEMGMRQIFSSLFGRLNSPRQPYIPSINIFPELDLDRIKRHFSLKKEGLRRGERDTPPSDSKTFDDIENKIITFIESEKRKAHQTLVNHLKTYGDRILSLNFQTKFTELLATADFAGINLRQSVNEGKGILFQLRRSVGRIEREIEAFKENNRLARMASYPNSYVLSVAVPLLLLVLESGLNGSFLAVGSEFGLLGGFIDAFLIAAFNVGGGIFFGWAIFREKNHKHWPRKMLGWFGIPLYLVALFLFNLLVAHYRDALGGQHPDQAATLAIKTFQDSPFTIADMKSWMLLALGCIFSIVNAIDGYKLDDQYPGYGKLVRRQLEIMEGYNQQKQAQMEELETIRDQAISKMESSAKDIENRRAEYHAILGSRQKLEADFEQYIVYLEQCANDMLSFYRETNRSSRNTSTPTHFSLRWEIARPYQLSKPNEKYTGYPVIENEIAEVFSHLNEKREKIRSEYETAVFEYKNIEQLTEEALRNGPQGGTGA